jgi:hypothetical protein
VYPLLFNQRTVHPRPVLDARYQLHLPPANIFINQFKPGCIITRQIKDAAPFSGMTSAQITTRVNKALASFSDLVDDVKPTV